MMALVPKIFNSFPESTLELENSEGEKNRDSNLLRDTSPLFVYSPL